MKINQTKWLAFIGLTLSIQANSQVKIPVTNNELRTNLTRVVEAFPGHFSELRGDTLIENPQTIEFASLLDFKTARTNSITQYKSIKPIYSWQAILINTEEFDEAVKKYKWLYNQLKVMTIALNNGYSFTMSGDYDVPDESRKFSSSIFKLTPNASSMPKLKIEVSMQFEFPEWKVSLLVYEKEREDNERGDIFGE